MQFNMRVTFQNGIKIEQLFAILCKKSNNLCFKPLRFASSVFFHFYANFFVFFFCEEVEVFNVC